MHIQAKGHHKTEATKKAGTVSHLENYGLQCSARKWGDTSLCSAEGKTLYGKFPLGVPFCSAPSGFILPPSSLLLWSTVTSLPDTEEKALRWKLCYRINKIKCSEARDILVTLKIKWCQVVFSDSRTESPTLKLYCTPCHFLTQIKEGFYQTISLNSLWFSPGQEQFFIRSLQTATLFWRVTTFNISKCRPFNSSWFQCQRKILCLVF